MSVAPGKAMRVRCSLCRRSVRGLPTSGSVDLFLAAPHKRHEHRCPGSGQGAPFVKLPPVYDSAYGREAAKILLGEKEKYREAERILLKQLLGIDVPCYDVTDLFGVAQKK